MSADKIMGYGLMGLAGLHLVLGANDPLGSIWSALASSLEIFVLLFGAFLVFFGAKALA